MGSVGDRKGLLSLLEQRIHLPGPDVISEATQMTLGWLDGFSRRAIQAVLTLPEQRAGPVLYIIPTELCKVP